MTICGMEWWSNGALGWWVPPFAAFRRLLSPFCEGGVEVVVNSELKVESGRRMGRKWEKVGGERSVGPV